MSYSSTYISLKFNQAPNQAPVTMAAKPFNRVILLARVALLSTATTLPLLLMLTVFMPRGFSGVPHMYVVEVVFVVSFGLVAVVE